MSDDTIVRRVLLATIRAACIAGAGAEATEKPRPCVATPALEPFAATPRPRARTPSRRPLALALAPLMASPMQMETQAEVEAELSGRRLPEPCHRVGLARRSPPVQGRNRHIRAASEPRRPEREHACGVGAVVLEADGLGASARPIDGGDLGRGPSFRRCGVESKRARRG